MDKQQMMADLQARGQRLAADPQARAKALERDRERRLEEFDSRHPGSAAWLRAAAARGLSFACDMLAKIHSGQAMTPNMVAAIERCIAQDAEYAQRRTDEQARQLLVAVPVDTTVAMPAVETAFARARQQGIKWPKIYMEGFVISPAGENSHNKGAIYVRRSPGGEGSYLGKVLGGAFIPARECDDATRDKVLAVMQDPLAAAVAYGQKFGRCSICHRELSDEESVAAGIGPVCRTRMFGGA